MKLQTDIISLHTQKGLWSANRIIQTVLAWRNPSFPQHQAKRKSISLQTALLFLQPLTSTSYLSKLGIQMQHRMNTQGIQYSIILHLLHFEAKTISKPSNCWMIIYRKRKKALNLDYLQFHMSVVISLKTILKNKDLSEINKNGTNSRQWS
jgi:hypothetical protein